MGLFKPVSKSYDKEKAIEAVEKYTSQRKLARAAQKANLWEVREIAVKKLTDQAVLAKAAMSDPYNEVRIAAIARLEDQAVLAELARQNEFEPVRVAAIRRLSDQTLIAEVAKHGYIDERMTATEKLADQALAQEMYENLANSAPYGNVSIMAAERLTDQALTQRLYANIARNAWHSDSRCTAVSRLTDQAVLHEIAKKDEDAEVRSAAIKKLRDMLIASNGDYLEMLRGRDVDSSFLFTTDKRLFSSYKSLAEVLGSHDWHGANLLTHTILDDIINSNRKKRHSKFHRDEGRIPWIYIGELSDIPLLDMLTLERLWCQSSDARYGFCAQYRLFVDSRRDFSLLAGNIERGKASYRDEPAGLYPNWPYCREGEVLLKELPFVDVEEFTDYEPQRILVSDENDQDWYEDRYAGGRSSHLEYADGWVLGTTSDGWDRTGWYRTVKKYDDCRNHPNLFDPHRGLTAVLALLEKHGITEPEKLLYHPETP